ncbi:hypothetical protein LN482_04510, partial [Xanthomonas euvesicatoria pv. euvesicatoria]|uniref:hypothetical protein n=1 Tax=Xanthomonas euvesicatoria TaxID=456327 RepID=UPI001E3E7253
CDWKVLPGRQYSVLAAGGKQPCRRFRSAATRLAETVALRPGAEPSKAEWLLLGGFKDSLASAALARA